MVLSDKQLDFLARAASWKFDVSFKNERMADDSVVYTGDGVDDLDRLINRLEAHAASGSPSRCKILCDTGSLFSNYVAVTADDVRALRQRYVEIWGNVDKPRYRT